MRAFLEKQNRPGSHRKPHQPKKGSRQTTIQRKAAISGPNDIHEKEADRAAEQITRSREQAPQTICPCGGGCPNCSTGKKSRNQPLLQPKSLQPSNSREIEVPESVDKVLSRPGDPLDRETRNDLEPRFGSDFSSVRLHHDSLAARSAKDIGARAYTVGSDIVFGAGQYAAGSSETRHLLAHELAHVVQQSQSVGNQQFIQRQTDGSDDTARPAAPAATNASLSQAFIGFACEAVSNIRTGVEEGRAWGFENVATLRSDASGGADLFAARQQALQELVWTLAEMIEGLEAGSIVPTEPATFGTMRELWISRNPDMIPGTDQWATLFPNEILPPEIAQPEYPGIYINICGYMRPAENFPQWSSSTSRAAGWSPEPDVFPRASLPTWWIIACHARRGSGDHPAEGVPPGERATAAELGILDSVIYRSGSDLWDFEPRGVGTYPLALGTIFDWHQDEDGNVYILIDGRRRYLLRNARLEAARDPD